MSKTHSFFLALLVAVLMAVFVPLLVELWYLLLTHVSSMGVFTYSSLMACVALPFLYVMFRRMT
jgi:hypothetical protein